MESFLCRTRLLRITRRARCYVPFPCASGRPRSPASRWLLEQSASSETPHKNCISLEMVGFGAQHWGPPTQKTSSRQLWPTRPCAQIETQQTTFVLLVRLASLNSRGVLMMSPVERGAQGFSRGAIAIVTPAAVKHVLKDKFENYVKGAVVQVCGSAASAFTLASTARACSCESAHTFSRTMWAQQPRRARVL